MIACMYPEDLAGKRQVLPLSCGVMVLPVNERSTPLLVEAPPRNLFLQIALILLGNAVHKIAAQDEIGVRRVADVVVPEICQLLIAPRSAVVDAAHANKAHLRRTSWDADAYVKRFHANSECSAMD